MRGRIDRIAARRNLFADRIIAVTDRITRRIFAAISAVQCGTARPNNVPGFAP
jgi:hypothetical protein